MKPLMAIKLTGGSHYGTSLLWVSLFGSFQPCVWLTRKIEALQNFKHKLLPQFSASLTKLSRPSGHPKQCVIRWFSFTSVQVYQGFQVVFSANRHLTYSVHGISLRYLGIHALLKNHKWRYRIIYLKAFSKRESLTYASLWPIVFEYRSLPSGNNMSVL